MARPSTYEEKLPIAQEYLKKALEKFNIEDGKKQNFFPSVAELSLVLDVSRSTVYKWAEEHEEFSDILEKILASQERDLIEKGLNGVYNASIAKLVLGKHGYHEKQETDLTSKGQTLSPLLVKFINDETDRDTS